MKYQKGRCGAVVYKMIIGLLFIGIFQHNVYAISSENVQEAIRDELLVDKSYLKELAPLSKEYTYGDVGDEVIKIKEWLMLWQFDENYVDILIGLSINERWDYFGPKTKTLVQEVQKFMGIEPTGIVNHITWQHLVSPLKKSFSINAYNKKSLHEKMKYFSSKHLQFCSTELKKLNLGSLGTFLYEW